MKHKSVIGGLFEAIGYVLVFLAIQIVVNTIVGIGSAMAAGQSFAVAGKGVASGSYGLDTTATIVSSVVSSLLTLWLFFRMKWAMWSKSYLSMRPWDVLFWICVLAFGLIIPSLWLQERLNVEMPEQMERLFQDLMSSPYGYIIVGILAPLAEETVFRGAVLRLLLKLFNHRLPWIPIALSAALFGLVHGNEAQFVHAFLLGLLLGWFFYRTKSIVPGVVLHWMNNTIAYVLCNLRPDLADKSLSDICGNELRILLYVGFSLLIVLPSLYQISIRMKASKE